MEMVTLPDGRDKGRKLWRRRVRILVPRRQWQGDRVCTRQQDRTSPSTTSSRAYDRMATYVYQAAKKTA